MSRPDKTIERLQEQVRQGKEMLDSGEVPGIMSTLENAEALLAYIAELEMERKATAQLKAAVKEAGVVFRRYERIHAEKNSPSGTAKMLSNRDLAEQMEQALASASADPNHRQPLRTTATDPESE